MLSTNEGRFIRGNPHRLYNYEPLTPLRTLRASVFGRLVCVKGTVVRVSNIKPLCTRMAFRCQTCTSAMSLPLQHGKYATPTKVCVHGSSYQQLFSEYQQRLEINCSFSFTFVFDHQVYPAWMSQSFLHSHPQFPPHTHCRLADHQVSVSKFQLHDQN